ncbi:hypothetical protein IQ266_12225 [filamentous cyanobacterium LEGE 11480]|uniref:Phthiocerol/phthiodiolone dimycocerosyl transferase n=1 Tax=Romeriopsis navalis LEGE 11480 TaxID=2777977 RepID=A0A928Z4M0_9CYAN|nr:acyltransferase [Romeriopsis navalis]MBE9030498.1 hypothetical protein [Romeriopsis navalis LEGE 11480]
MIERQHPEQWLEIAENELLQQFSGESVPLCRITLLQSSEQNPTNQRISSLPSHNELIVTFHHAIADGMSALHVMHALCACYQQVIEGVSPPTVSDRSLKPPLEQLLAPCLAGLDVAELEQLLPSQPTESPQLLIEQTARVADRKTRLIPFELNPAHLSRLKQRCRDEQTTVHGALCAALSLACVAQSLAVQVPVPITCGSSVDLRPACEPLVEASDLGCVTFNITTSHHVSPKADFWDLARECQADVARLVQAKIPHYRGSSAELLNQYQASFLAQLAEHNMGRITTCHVSNLGQSNAPTAYGSIALESFHFATGQSLVGVSCWMGAVTINQTLCGTFTYVTPLMSPETANTLADSVITNLTRSVA